jgi:hypothetical protein
MNATSSDQAAKLQGAIGYTSALAAMISGFPAGGPVPDSL